MGDSTPNHSSGDQTTYLSNKGGTITCNDWLRDSQTTHVTKMSRWNTLNKWFRLKFFVFVFLYKIPHNRMVHQTLEAKGTTSMMVLVMAQSSLIVRIIFRASNFYTIHENDTNMTRKNK